VAGGTAIGLSLISGGAERAQRLYRRYRADLLEKVAVLGFIVMSLVLLLGFALPQGVFGTLLSGGWIPWLNMLVALKVTLGSWAMVQLFVRYRGLF
jgi:multicomponent Na+:H+ antiporter subunit B